MPDTAGPGANVTSGSGAKGAWTQLIASTSEDYKGLLMSIGSGNGNGILTDIGIGGAGAEAVIVPNLMAVARSTAFGQAVALIPIMIPAGSRVSARCAASAAITVFVSCSGIRDTFVIFDGMDSHLATTDYYGVTIPTGNSPTKGAWTQLVASTSRAYDAILPMFSNAGAYASGGRKHWFDFGLGAAAAEVAFVTDLGVGDDATHDVVEPQNGPIIRKAIPAGTRISCRGTAGVGGSTASVAVGLLYGANFADLSGPLAV